MKKLLGILLLASLLFLMLVPFAFAQDNGVEVDETPLADLLKQIGTSVPISFVVAFGTTMLGYLRNTPPEDFDLTKFLATLMLSVLLGVITTATGWDYTTAEVWLANAGLTIWIYWLAKVIAIRLGWVAAEKVEAPVAG